MSDNLDEWLNSGGTHIDDYKTARAKGTPDKSTEFTSAPIAAIRGAASGLTMGTWPSIAGGLSTGFGYLGDYEKSKAESEAAQEKAWQERPNWYGTGYGAGTVASLASGPGLLGKGAMAIGKAATPAAKALTPLALDALASATPIGGRAAVDLGTGVIEGAYGAAKQSGAFDRLGAYLAGPAKLKGIPLGSRGGTPTRAAMLGTELYTGANGPNLPDSEEENLEERRRQMDNKTVPKDRQ